MTSRKSNRRERNTAQPATRPLPPEWGTRSPTYESRMKAAGFRKDDAPPADIDAFRYALARRIAMFINDWRGCPEPLCKRMRGCMAPHNACSNAKPRPPVSDEQFARFMAKLQRMVRESIDRRDAEEG